VTPVTGPVQITRYLGGERNGERIVGAICIAHFADKFHVDKQKTDRVESAVLFSLTLIWKPLLHLRRAFKLVGATP
jgi:hypothetical protein